MSSLHCDSARLFAYYVKSLITDSVEKVKEIK